MEKDQTRMGRKRRTRETRSDARAKPDLPTCVERAAAVLVQPAALRRPARPGRRSVVIFTVFLDQPAEHFSNFQQISASRAHVRAPHIAGLTPIGSTQFRKNPKFIC